MTFKDLVDDCEFLSKEEFVTLTGCDPGKIPHANVVGIDHIYGVNSQDQMFLFLQWQDRPRHVFRVFRFENGAFSAPRHPSEVMPIVRIRIPVGGSERSEDNV